MRIGVHLLGNEIKNSVHWLEAVDIVEFVYTISGD